MTIDISTKKLSVTHTECFQKATGPQNSYDMCFQNYYHGHNYLNPNPQYITNVKANVNHFQLRDLLQVDQYTGDAYFTKSYSLWKLSEQYLGKYVTSEVLKPDYAPKCLDVASNGFLATGGLMTSAYKIFYSNIEGVRCTNQSIARPQKGLFTFCNSNLNISKTVKLGEMINNSVLLDNQGDPNASQLKSYVCNNDSSLYMLDILNNDRITNTSKIVCEHDISLNSVLKSPTDNILAVTGDTPLVYLVDPKTSSVSQKLQTPHDSGFGLSFHPSGQILSVAFQNGHCLLYDLRNLSVPLHTIKSTRPGHQLGAFRACKFSNASFSDILVVSEHVGRVHVVDLRNFNESENHQVIVFPFALDQYADFQVSKEKEHQNQTENEENHKSDTEEHHEVAVYDEKGALFTAPLVYDYDYLTNVSPRLFKYYTYSPELKQEFPSPGSSPQQDTYGGNFDGVYSTGPTTYHNADNHIHGEMELSGLDWFGQQLFIGCENGGILKWDVNHIARRSFGSFSFV